jgi:hypothetical protein
LGEENLSSHLTRKPLAMQSVCPKYACHRAASYCHAVVEYTRYLPGPVE